LPKTKREEVAALITILALLEGVFFDTRDVRKLLYDPKLVSKVIKSLLESNLLVRIHSRRNYILTETFRETLKKEVLRKAPSSGIHQFPALDVFYVGGMEDWGEHEFEIYVSEMREMWQRLSRSRRPAAYP
jgi:DNA-binding MarR family transcriptional regulator